MANVLDFLIKYKWYVIGAIIALIIGIIIYRNWYKIAYYFQPRDVDFETDSTTGTIGNDITNERKKYLESLASELYNDIYDTPIIHGHNLSLYAMADVLPDVELLYLARFYKRNLTQSNTLYYDINDEYYVLDNGSQGGDTNSPTKLKQHLSKIGEK